MTIAGRMLTLEKDARIDDWIAQRKARAAGARP